MISVNLVKLLRDFLNLHGNSLFDANARKDEQEAQILPPSSLLLLQALHQTFYCRRSGILEIQDLPMHNTIARPVNIAGP
jgi:hypothetical protein